MSFRIKFTQAFRDEYYALEKVEKERVYAFVSQLKENPLMVGKPLGFRFLREKKFNGKRLYFLVYEEWLIVLLTRLSDKKGQSETIAWIKENLPDLRTYVRGLVEKDFNDPGYPTHTRDHV